MVINAECGKTVRIAYQGENKRQKVRFDLSDIMGEFPGGTAALVILRNGDNDAVPAAITEMDGTSLLWTVTAWECEHDGFLYAQITYATADNVVAKDKKYRFDIKDSLVVGGVEPETWEDYVGQLVTAAAGVNDAISQAMDTLDEKVTAAETAQSAAEAAQRSAEEAVGQYDDMTATATGLAAGSAPTAEIDHTGSAPVLRLGIPAGERGADGAQGPKGDKGDPGEDADPSDLIDDTAASTSKTFSSSKLETQRGELLSAIEGKEDKPGLVVTFLSITPDAGNVATGTVTADKTPDEVLAAYTAGKTIKAISTISGTPMECDLQIAYETFASFECPVGRSMYYQVSGNPGGNWTYQLRNSLIGDTQSYWVWYHRLTNVTDPVDAQDAATKKYVDNAKADVDKNKADIIITNASGSIAAITDGADDLPIEDMVVQIEPVQDLHGQSSPYPGGGGKNKVTFPYAFPDGVYGGVTFTTTGEKIVASGNTNNSFVLTLAKVTLPAGSYVMSVDGTHTRAQFRARVSGTNLNTLNPDNSYATFTLESESEVTFDLVRTATLIDINTHFQVESGSTPTAWTPYSNICPISGWTGCNVTRCGKNLIDPTAKQQTSATVAQWYAGGYKLHAGVTYKLSSTNPAVTVYFSNLDNSTIASGSPTATYTPSADIVCKFRAYLSSGISDIELQLELGSATAYAPYQGATYPITFPTEAGTVYGGTVNPVTGELVVDRASITFDGTQSVGLPRWQQKSGSSAWLYAPSQTPGIEETSSGNTIPNIISDMLPTVAYTPIYGGTIGISRVQGTGTAWGLAVRVPVEGLTTAQLINAWLAEHPIHVVYKITNPQTYTLTPTEIRTLLGYNAIFADVGDVSVDYRADTKLYIDNKITQAIAAALNS